MADTNEQIEANIIHELKVFLIEWLSLPEIYEYVLQSWADSEGYSDTVRLKFVLFRLRNLVSELEDVSN